MGFLDWLIGSRLPAGVVKNGREASGTPEQPPSGEMQAAIERLNDGLSPVFITGPAGSGKSTLLRSFKGQTRRNCAVVAPTGLAALNVGGVTAHSLFGLPLGLIRQRDIRINPRKAEVLKKLETLIIDEVSMMRADVLDGIDASLRLHRGDTRTFGGVQLILFGDPFQLPPVVADDGLRDYFSHHYSSEYFFSAKALEQQQLHRIELTKIYRQVGDPGFLESLNRIRVGSATFDDWVSINDRYGTYSDEELDGALTLTTTNKAAAAINGGKLERLSLPEASFAAKIDGDFSEDALPVDKTLRVRPGAQIIMLRNNGTNWVNGSIGKVKSWSDEGICVRIDRSDYVVEQHTWAKVDYEYDREKGAIVEVIKGSVKQFPMRLAWALTIHKSQGQTLERVAIDMGTGAFAHGQLYVALSRCKTRGGVYLKKPVDQMSMLVDPRICKFMGVSDSVPSPGNRDFQYETLPAAKFAETTGNNRSGATIDVVKGGLQERVDAAMREGTAVRIRYRDYAGSETTRSVSPTNWIDSDRFSAFCHLRSGDREFRVSRILEVDASASE